MSSVNVFYQLEGVRDIEHIEVDGARSVKALKALLVEKHGVSPAEVHMFLEDSDEALADSAEISEQNGCGGVKVHIHRCRHVQVTVTFNNETVQHRFGPGVTVARVKRWAAEQKFDMSKEEASEHVLQITDTHDRPAPGTHIGTLASCPNCQVSFDLVADQRVNGSGFGAEV